MSPTDNVIHLVLVTCYSILNGAASKIAEEMHALSWCIKSPMTRLQSVKVTDFHHPWDIPETCTQTVTLDHIRSHYVEHNRERNRHDKTEILLKVALSTINPNATKKGFIFPSNHSRLEPPTSDSSAEWLSRVIQDCHYHISSLYSLAALYIFLNLFLIVFFFFLLPFSHRNSMT